MSDDIQDSGIESGEPGNEAQSPTTNSSSPLDFLRTHDDDTDEGVQKPRLMTVSPTVSSEKDAEKIPKAVDVPTMDPSEVTQQSSLIKPAWRDYTMEYRPSETTLGYLQQARVGYQAG